MGAAMANRTTIGGHRKGPMHSQAQWRWAYATHKEFAHRWAEEIVATRGKKTGFHSLPKRTGVRRRI